MQVLASNFYDMVNAEKTCRSQLAMERVDTVNEKEWREK